AAIRDLVAALDQLSLAKHRRITVPLAREILNEQDQSLF
ncbi:MAG TPA: DNA replication protein, partial [Rhodospirillaceae bacterium]|nr:DNA replication protein [Rhodospirillaceae bacterium]